MAADRLIGWSTALAVLGVAAVGATASYEHAYDLMRAHCKSGGPYGPAHGGWPHLRQFDGELDSARRKAPVPALAVAPRPRHCGDACSQRDTRPWPWAVWCRRGRVASGR